MGNLYVKGMYVVDMFTMLKFVEASPDDYCMKRIVWNSSCVIIRFVQYDYDSFFALVRCVGTNYMKVMYMLVPVFKTFLTMNKHDDMYRGTSHIKMAGNTFFALAGYIL